MRFIIYGAGAIGGVIGARLFQHGHEVVLIARGAHLDALRESGLVLESPEERVVLDVPVAGSPDELALGDDDVVLLAMKTQHTEGALLALRAAGGGHLPVICAQNGVANERMAARRFPRVYGMVVFLPATHLRPGVVQASSSTCTGVLDAGVYPSGTDATIERVTAALEASRCSAYAEPAIMRWKYAKLLGNLNNALQAACEPGREGGDIRERLRNEALDCYARAGIDCASDEEFRKRRGSLIQIGPIAGSVRGGGSSWQSLARGTGSIETDWLNGEIVQLGRQHGVPTPANLAVTHIANELARAGGKPGSVPLARVREAIARAEREDG